MEKALRIHFLGSEAIFGVELDELMQELLVRTVERPEHLTLLALAVLNRSLS